MRNPKSYCYNALAKTLPNQVSVQKKINHQSSLGSLQSLTIISDTKTDVRVCYTKWYTVRNPNPKISFTLALPGALNVLLNVLIKMNQTVKPDAIISHHCSVFT